MTRRARKCDRYVNHYSRPLDRGGSFIAQVSRRRADSKTVVRRLGTYPVHEIVCLLLMAGPVPTDRPILLARQPSRVDGFPISLLKPARIDSNKETFFAAIPN